MGTSLAIVTPCHNYGRFLRRAVDSALAQQRDTTAAVQVMVVDDASTDDTPQIAQSYGRALTYLRQDRGGPFVACRRAYFETTTDYLLFLDADDRLRDGYVAAMMRAFEATPDARMAFGQIINVCEDGSQRRSPLPRIHPDPLANFAGYMQGRLQVSAGGAVLHRAAFERLVPLPEESFRNHGIDRVLIGQALANYRAAIAPDAVIELYDHPHRLRRDAEAVCAAGLSAMKLLFAPEILPAPALALQNTFAAKLHLEQATLLYRRGRYAQAREAYHAALRCDRRQVMNLRHLRRMTISTVGAWWSGRRNEPAAFGSHRA